MMGELVLNEVEGMGKTNREQIFLYRKTTSCKQLLQLLYKKLQLYNMLKLNINIYLSPLYCLNA